MSIVQEPPLVRWARGLSPAQEALVRGFVDQTESLPAIEADGTPAGDAVESWLQTTVAETYDRVKAGTERLFTPAEADAWFADRRSARA